jgi:hypothetical protein
VKKSVGRQPLGRLRKGWKDNVKMNQSTQTVRGVQLYKRIQIHV